MEKITLVLQITQVPICIMILLVLYLYILSFFFNSFALQDLWTLLNESSDYHTTAITKSENEI